MNALPHGLLVFTLFSATPHILGAGLTPVEKQDFARWYSEEHVTEASIAGEGWTVRLLDLDLDGDGTNEVLACNSVESGRAGDVITAYRRWTNGWEAIDGGDGSPGTRLFLACAVESVGRPPRFGWIQMTTGGSSGFKDFWTEPADCSDVPGSPVEPFLSESERTAFLQELESGPWTGIPPQAEEDRFPFLSENEQCWDCCFFSLWDFRQISLDTNGTVSCPSTPGGVRDLIADPGFRMLTMRLRDNEFSGTNAMPVSVADSFAATGTGSGNPAGPTLSQTERQRIAEALASFGFSTNSVCLVVNDMNGDGVPDALVSTNPVLRTESLLEWRVWTKGTNGWTPALDSLCPSGLQTSETGVAFSLTAPHVPPVFTAGRDDLYRIWTSPSHSYLNVFRVTGPNPWDVESPLSDDETPAIMRRSRFLNGYRREFSCWLANHRWFQPEDLTNPPCEFFDLFHFRSGMIRLERLVPEPLLP